MYVVNGMVREATQELGGRKPPAVMENAYVKARSEGVVPGMQAALVQASAGLEVELSVKDLDRDVCAEASETLGSEKGAEGRVWLRRFRSVRHLLVPAIVLPIRYNFWPPTARRVRPLNFPDHRESEVLVWGSECRAALNTYRSVDPARVVQTRGRDVAASSSPRKRANLV